MQKLIVSALAAAAGIAAAGAVSAAEMLDLPATKVDGAPTTKHRHTSACIDLSMFFFI